MESTEQPARRPGVRGPDKRKRFVFYPSRWRARYGPKARHTRHHNEKRTGHHFKTKLTVEQVKWIKGALLYDIRARRSAGYVIHTPGIHVRLAEKFGVTVSNICQISRGKRWQKVETPRWSEPDFSGTLPIGRPKKIKGTTRPQAAEL